MAHKTIVGGTEYNITGGKTMAGGTVYAISGGKTIVGGVEYSIAFKSDFVKLMQDATLYDINGRNNSSKGTSSISLYPDATYYVFGFYNGGMYIFKVAVETGSIFASYTLTTLYGSYTLDVTRMNDRISCQLSSDGEDSVSAYGQTIAAFTFPSFSEAEVDTILSGLAIQDSSGRNSSSRSSVFLALSTGCTILSAHDAYVGISFPVGTVIYGNHSSNPSLIYVNGSTAYISTSGASATTVYGGTLVKL